MLWAASGGISTLSKRTSIDLMARLTQNVNDGVVTTNPNHMNGATTPIGFTTIDSHRGTALFVGVEQGCNEGVVSTNFNHLLCKTKDIGFTLL